MRPLLALVLLVTAPPLAADGTLRALLGVDANVWGAQPTGTSTLARAGLSPDGDRVLFTSAADNLAVNAGGGTQVYLLDRTAGELTLVSGGAGNQRADAGANGAAMSASGSHVAWVSAATNLVPADTPGTPDLFVQRIADGQRLRIALPSDLSFQPLPVPVRPALSADGSRVLVGAAITSGAVYALFLCDTASAACSRITPPLVAETPEYLVSDFTLSHDAATAVLSFQRLQVPAPPEVRSGILAIDTQTLASELVSRDASGVPVDTVPGSVQLAQGARVVAFTSNDGRFVPGDANGQFDIFLRDRLAGTTSIASVLPGGSLDHGAVTIYALSPDGSRVAFVAPQPNGLNPVGYIHAPATGVTTALALISRSSALALDAGGGEVAFDSDLDDVVAGDSNGTRDVFVHALAGGTTVRASLATSGPFPTVPCCVSNLAASSSGDWLGVTGARMSPVLDSRYALWSQAGGTEPLALPPENRWRFNPGLGSISDDGAVVSMASIFGSIVIDPPPPPSPTQPQTLVLRRATTQEVPVALTATGDWPDGGSGQARLSADGRFAVFESEASDHIPGANPLRNFQVYRRDLDTGELRLVSATSGGVGGNSDSRTAAISRDGRWVAFLSFASDLDPPDGNGATDVMLWDAQSGSVERVSLASDGSEVGNGFYQSLGVCDGGQRIAWISRGAVFVPGGSSVRTVAFLRDRTTGQTSRLSENVAGEEYNADTFQVSLSADCSTVAFNTAATNTGFLVPSGTRQVYVRALPAGAAALQSVDRLGIAGQRSSDSPLLSANGSTLYFLSSSGNWTLDAGDATGVPNVFARVLGDTLFRDGFE